MFGYVNKHEKNHIDASQKRFRKRALRHKDPYVKQSSKVWRKNTAYFKCLSETQVIPNMNTSFSAHERLRPNIIGYWHR